MGFSIFTELYNLITILKHSHDPKRSPIPISSHPHPLPSPWQRGIHSLCLWICLFWTFPINGITHCGSFCVWLLSLSIVFSRTIHVVVSVSASPLFMTEWCSRVWRDHSCLSIICWWTFGLLSLWGCYESRCHEHSCTSFHVDSRFCFSGADTQERNCWVR